MSLAAPPPAYLHIEDRIDAVGQKYRVQRILRGAMLLAIGFIVISFLAALIAHWLGQSICTRAVLIAWAVATALMTWRWFVRPMLIRPDLVEVARFVESRVEGLHNALTNGLLLSRREDLSQSPWLPEILNEIAAVSGDRPLGGAVRLGDLRPLALRGMFILLPLVLLMAFTPRSFIHGWRQLFSPTAFVPTVGMAEIIDVQPKDVTLVTGQALEISIAARCPGSPRARVVFARGEGADAAAPIPESTELTATSSTTAGAGQSLSDMQFSYRLEHVDHALRYRVEVAGTQSPWFAVTVVRQVKLATLELHVIPPAYTRAAPQTIRLTSADVASANVAVCQGSRVELSAMVDVPLGSAMLDSGSAEPTPMDASAGGLRFSTALTIFDDTPVAILLTVGGQQIVARLPDQPLVIHCVKDQPPAIEMKWPTQDTTAAPQAELKVHALVRDDYGVSRVRVLMAAVESAPGDAADKGGAEKGAAEKGAADGNASPADLPAVHDEVFAPGTGTASASTSFSSCR